MVERKICLWSFRRPVRGHSNNRRESFLFSTRTHGTREAIALGFQHYILSLGTVVMIPTFLVPLMGGGGFDYLKHFQTKQVPILERFALLLPVTVIWAYAHLLTASGAYKHHPQQSQMNCRTNKANLISSAPWIKIPYPLQWGAPTFDVGHAFGMMVAELVSLIESTRAYKAASHFASATPPPPAHVLSRGIGCIKFTGPTLIFLKKMMMKLRTDTLWSFKFVTIILVFLC